MIFIYVISDHSDERQEKRPDTEKGVAAPPPSGNLPLFIQFSGSGTWGPGHKYERLASDIFAVELVIAGNARFVQDGKEYSVEPGSVYFLRKGSRHVYSTGPAGLLHKRYVNIDGLLLDPLLRAFGLMDRDTLRLSDPAGMETLLRAINRLVREKPDDYANRLSESAYALLLRLGREAGPRLPEPVTRAIRFIESRLTRPIGSAQIARAAGLSVTHCNRLFRKHMGVPPVRYLLDQRMR